MLIALKVGLLLIRIDFKAGYVKTSLRHFSTREFTQQRILGIHICILFSSSPCLICCRQNAQLMFVKH